MRGARIIYKVRIKSAAERLEDEAKKIVVKHQRRQIDEDAGLVRASTAETIIEREIALTLSHLDSVRHMHKGFAHDLLLQECYIGTEIIQRTPRGHVYFDSRLPERDRLRDKLRDIGRERRRLAMIHDFQVRQLQDKLLPLLDAREGARQMTD